MANIVGPKGIGSSSLIPEVSSGRRTGQLRVDGMQETVQNLNEWGSITAYITSLTSKKVAQSIMGYSNRILPFDTGELMDSGFIDTVEGADAGGKLSGRTIAASDSKEGTVEYANLIPEISTAFTVAQKGFGGSRTYTKYACGYTADHAATVHENPFNAQWNTSSKSGQKNPFGDGPKRDHFLLEAYNAHKDKFSLAMKAGIEQVNAQFEARVSSRNRALPGLSAGTGKPRLIKR